MSVGMTVNGQAGSIIRHPRTTLLITLRDELGLTGTTNRCDRGECGAVVEASVDQRV